MVAIERVRARVLDQGLEFVWSSPWKASPDRSMAARAVFRVADDGRGRATIEAQDRRSGELIARSAPALAHTTLAGFRASAKTLRWVARSVQLTPRTGWSHDDEVVSLDPGLGEIHVGSPDRRADSAQVELPVILRAPYDSHIEDRTPGIDLFLGFGIGLRLNSIPDAVRSTLHEGITLELFDRIGSGEAGIREWVDGLPVEVTLEYHLPAEVDGFGEFGIRLRRTKESLGVVVLRDATWMVGDDVTASEARAEVADLVGQLIAAMGERARGGAPRRR